MSTGLESPESGTSFPAQNAGTPYYQAPTDQLVSSLEQLAASSSCLLSKPAGHFSSQGNTYALPRYVLSGRQGGGDILRLGLFATLRGDEPEGALTLVSLVNELVRQPELAANFCLFIYPVCNPTGLEDHTARTRAGHDLNREFWRQSAAPEVRFLESEIWMHAFHGVVVLSSDRETDGIYGQVNGLVLSEYLLKPALKAANVYLPRNRKPIDGVPSHHGIVHQIKEGVLQPPPKLHPSPFEIILASPSKLPLQLQVAGMQAALLSILHEYRTLMSVAHDI